MTKKDHFRATWVAGVLVSLQRGGSRNRTAGPRTERNAAKRWGLPFGVLLLAIPSSLLASGPGMIEGREGTSSKAKVVQVDPAKGSATAPATSQDEVARACRLLGTASFQNRFPGLSDSLCARIDPRCAEKVEKACDASITCRAIRGSGSGPGCAPCTPDWVFWRCESHEKSYLAQAVLASDLCLKSNGQWETGPKSLLGYCRCDPDAAFVSEKGCRSLKDLCTEKSGRWIKASPQPLRSKKQSEAYCERNGRKLDYKEYLPQ